MTNVVDMPSQDGAPEATSGLVLRSVRNWYGDTRALEGMDLQARPGEILGVAGPNGAGKSTVIKILAGETREDAGEFWLDGAASWPPRLASPRRT